MCYSGRGSCTHWYAWSTLSNANWCIVFSQRAWGNVQHYCKQNTEGVMHTASSNCNLATISRSLLETKRYLFAFDSQRNIEWLRPWLGKSNRLQLKSPCVCWKFACCSSFSNVEHRSIILKTSISWSEIKDEQETKLFDDRPPHRIC